jgi:hypothetical protein
MSGWSGGYEFVSSSPYPPLSGWSVVGETFIVTANEGACVSLFMPMIESLIPPFSCPCDSSQGFYANKFEILCQKVIGNMRPNSSEWVAIDFTSQLTSTMIDGYITQEGLTGNTFVSSWYSPGLATSYLEGCNVLTAAVSTPANSFGHSLLFVWGPEAQGDLTRWFQLGGLWAFIALHGAFGLIGFMLRQFEIARSVNLRPYNAIAFSAPISIFVSVFLEIFPFWVYF